MVDIFQPEIAVRFFLNSNDESVSQSQPSTSNRTPQKNSDDSDDGNDNNSDNYF